MIIYTIRALMRNLSLDFLYLLNIFVQNVFILLIMQTDYEIYLNA